VREQQGRKCVCSCVYMRVCVNGREGYVAIGCSSVGRWEGVCAHACMRMRVCGGGWAEVQVCMRVRLCGCGGGGGCI
jgi:hypothetical protein